MRVDTPFALVSTGMPGGDSVINQYWSDNIMIYNVFHVLYLVVTLPGCSLIYKCMNSPFGLIWKSNYSNESI